MSTATSTHFPVTVKANWAETNVIPPRCRIARTVHHDIEYTVNVRSITAVDFPVAIKYDDYGTEVDLHTFDGAIYQPWLPWSRQTEMHAAGSQGFAAIQHYDRHSLYADTLDEAHGIINASYSQFLIVDGFVWIMDNREPFYVAAYNPRNGESFVSVTTHAPNAGEWTCFNALERDEAIAYAVGLAADDRRDAMATKLRAEPAIRVFMPEAVTKSFDRVTSKGANDIHRFSDSAAIDFTDALEKARGMVDAGSVGRGETTYEDFLAAAVKCLMGD
jgi:hypothetical protein